MNNGILLVFGKSYQDNTSDERYFQSIILFNVHSMLRDIKYGLLRFHTICFMLNL